MKPNETTLRVRAEEAARATLARRWAPERSRVALASETGPLWSHVFQRAQYAGSFRVFERVGVALVATSPNGTRVTAAAAPSGTAAAAPPDVLAAALSAGEAALRRAGAPAELHVEATATAPARVLGAPGFEVTVCGFAPVPEGPLTIDLDAETGETLGWFFPAFLRGSRDGRAAGRAEVVKRVERDDALPAGAAFARGSLEETKAGRLWRLRYEVKNETSQGHVVLAAHGRTGALAGVSSFLLPVADLGRRSARERAEAAVAEALPRLLGCDAELTVLIAGAILRGGKRRAGWVGTARLADGAVARVSCCEGEVEAAVRGEAFRARIETPGPT